MGSRHTLFLILWLALNSVYAQPKDSLDLALQELTDDKAKLALLLKESEQTTYTRNDYSKELAIQALELANRIDDKTSKVHSIHQMGMCHYAISDFDLAAQYFLESLEMAESIKSDKWICEN